MVIKIICTSLDEDKSSWFQNITWNRSSLRCLFFHVKQSKLKSQKCTDERRNEGNHFYVDRCPPSIFIHINNLVNFIDFSCRLDSYEKHYYTYWHCESFHTISSINNFIFKMICHIQVDMCPIYIYNRISFYISMCMYHVLF